MAAEPSSRRFVAGMEVEPWQFTPPEVRPEPPAWERYRPPRFSRPIRIVITAAVVLLPGVLIMLSIGVLLTGGQEAEGRLRAAFVIFMMPVVPLVPLLLRALRDLWGGDR